MVKEDPETIKKREALAKRLQEGVPVEKRDPLAAYKERPDAVVTEPEVVF
jgi:hypothetical protein